MITTEYTRGAGDPLGHAAGGGDGGGGQPLNPMPTYSSIFSVIW